MQDVDSLKDENGGFCVQHNKVCPRMESGSSVELMIGGFSCKDNSLQNGARWEKDPMNRKSSNSLRTFDGYTAALASVRPLFFIVENVLGCRQGRIKE